jgi:hypothetical protein
MAFFHMFHIPIYNEVCAFSIAQTHIA